TADVARQAGWRVAGFVENLERARCEGRVEGLPVHWVDELGALARNHVAICGLGTTHRSRFTRQAGALGLRFATVVHPSAVVAPSSTLGEGCIVGPGVVVAAHSSLGRHVLLNRIASVGHHTNIGDHTSILPGAAVAGRCSVAESVYIGMGASIIDGVRVGAHSVVGAGAAVIDDVPERVLVVGVPARVVRTGIEGR
ncbi:MAG: NeuD/PglB/VioB family sugar acetyltransferase, partial [Chloroflexi bacterium]|nr:NeuD/PglB/VioB family sugar acetyltransferase [Chloroflexota bacterium]